MHGFVKSARLGLATAFLLPLLSLPAAAAPAAAGTAEVHPRPSLSQPALSPDGSEIVFASGGDLWTVPAAGGTARLLVAHPATESRPLYSPDGRQVAFVSTRTGNGDLYVLDRATGAVRRLTWDDAEEQLDAWSPDGRWLYFSSSSRDIAGMNDLLRVSVTGGTPSEVSAERYTNEFFAAPAPSGDRLAFSARGIASSQWWRNGHSHIDESEIWLLEGGAYRRLVGRGAKNLWPMWSADGKSLSFVSDRDGKENLWTQEIGGREARQLTRFRDGRVLWPTISKDGASIVFERNFALWKLDVASGKVAEIPVALDGAVAGPAIEHRRFTDDIDDFALSPDGKKVAFLVRGEIFAASAKDGGRAFRVTDTAGLEAEIVWAPDSRRIAYSSERGGDSRIYLYDFETQQETAAPGAAPGPGAADHHPVFSPDGKLLAFQRGRRQVVVVELASGRTVVAWDALLDQPPLSSDRSVAWSPDNRYLAVLTYGPRNFRNVWIVPVGGGEARQASFLANTGSNTLSWSPDGKFLVFDTGVRTEEGQLVRVDLVPRVPRFREDQFRDLFQEALPPSVKLPAAPDKPKEEKSADPVEAGASPAADSKDAKKPAAKVEPVVIEFEGIRQRLSTLPVGLDLGFQTISPDGKWLAFIAESAGRQNLYVYPLDELAKEPPVAKQLSATAGNKWRAQFTPDSQEIYFLDNDVIQIANLEGKVRPLAVNAELDVDFSEDRTAVFDQSWRYLRDHFFDSGMNGLDWSEIHGRYAPHVAGAQTPDELRRVLSFMIGDLNASHTGIRPPFSGGSSTTGHLGLRFEPRALEEGAFVVREVIPLGPAAVTGKVRAGDHLLSVNGRPLARGANLDQLLDYQIDRQVKLVVAADAHGRRDRREVVVRAIPLQAEKNLVYRAWVESNRAYVEKASGGRLGYVHIFDMSASSLTRLHQDLDTANQGREGVVVDIRNNNGGFINVYVNDILSRRGYLNMTYRGFPAAPARALLGQRALERPTILITNQHSLSDAEDMSEGYRALEIGKIVGEPTSGWIIYTSNINLVDGSILRLPFIRITDAKGNDMEMNPRPVDVPVERALGETVAGKDSQLDVAIRELLAQLGERER